VLPTGLAGLIRRVSALTNRARAGQK